MTTQLVPKKFYEIASSSDAIKEKDWAKAIPEKLARKLECQIASFTYGNDIGSHSGFTFGGASAKDGFKNHLGFVVSGMAEIYEESALEAPLASETSRYKNRYHAYRPIRLLREGDLFGDFSIVDKVLRIDGDARPGEVWHFCAGRKSVLVMGGLEKNHCTEFDCDEFIGQRRPDAFFKRNSKKIKTEIAFFESDELFSRNHEFFRELLFVAWQRAKTYRTSFNSYNFTSLLDFRRLLDKGALDLLGSATDSKPIYNPRVSKNSLLHIFSDALFDALNRPIRDEPVFAYVPGSLSDDCQAKLRDIKINENNVLVACPARAADVFYYPIDLHNHFINSFCRASNLVVHGKEALGWLKQKKATIVALRQRDFYRDLTQNTLKEYAKKKEMANYPYDVECIDVDALDGKLLLLKFSKRKRGT